MFVDDQTGTLSASEISKLQAIASPLDVKVKITSTDSRGQLDAEVGQMVTSANTLAIGIDPVHHYTFTHFGTGTGIGRLDYQAVARAGNGDFHAGHWADGLNDIVAAAGAASVRTAAAGGVVIQPTTVVEHETPAWPFVVGGGALLLFCVLIASWLKRRAKRLDDAVDARNEEASELRTRNVEEQGWHDQLAAKMGKAPAANQAAQAAAHAPVQSIHERRSGKYRQPSHSYVAPVILQQTGNPNDMLTGMLLGEAMSRPQQVVVERDPPRHSKPERASGYSGGSDSSSYDSGSSFDSGSSGGGFDSGGGGGFDGGGGGGDF